MSEVARIERGLAEMGIELPEAAHEKLAAFAALLAKCRITSYNVCYTKLLRNGSSSSLAKIIVAVLTIGIVGFLLDRLMSALQTAFTHASTR